MKVLIDWADNSYVMEAEEAMEIMAMVQKYGKEVYVKKRDWQAKQETHHVYAVTPAEVGITPIRVISDALYGMGKLKGRPTE